MLLINLLPFKGKTSEVNTNEYKKQLALLSENDDSKSSDEADGVDEVGKLAAFASNTVNRDRIGKNVVAVASNTVNRDKTPGRQVSSGGNTLSERTASSPFNLPVVAKLHS